MGEARRRREREINSSCICQSGLKATSCCFKNGVWFKSPVMLGLKNLNKGEALDKCYLKSLGSCGGGISSEHYVSHSVLKFLSEESDIIVQGLPWLRGKSKSIGLNSLTANCLCGIHNSKLSLIDDAAIKFFKAWYELGGEGDKQRNFLFSGHDIERWLLKTMMAMSVSKNFGVDNAVWNEVLMPSINVVDMLDDPTAWQEGVGLYIIAAVGDNLTVNKRLEIAPIVNRNNELGGIKVSLSGLNAVLSLQGRSLIDEAFTGALFRMEGFYSKNSQETRSLRMSWLAR